jgi:hypothetical protein
VVYPLANLLATEQVHLGDLVCIDWDRQHKELTFAREGEGALVSPAVPQIGQLAAAAEAKDGKTADPPTEVVVAERKLRAAQPSVAPTAAPQGRKKSDR